jgi:hypothetical protein
MPSRSRGGRTKAEPWKREGRSIEQVASGPGQQECLLEARLAPSRLVGKPMDAMTSTLDESPGDDQPDISVGHVELGASRLGCRSTDHGQAVWCSPRWESALSRPTTAQARESGAIAGPAIGMGVSGGRYWIRTSDLTDVNRAL